MKETPKIVKWISKRVGFLDKRQTVKALVICSLILVIISLFLLLGTFPSTTKLEGTEINSGFKGKDVPDDFKRTYEEYKKQQK